MWCLCLLMLLDLNGAGHQCGHELAQLDERVLLCGSDTLMSLHTMSTKSLLTLHTERKRHIRLASLALNRSQLGLIWILILDRRWSQWWWHREHLLLLLSWHRSHREGRRNR